MTRTHVGRLEVPGASLHYRARGNGPTLLLIHDDASDADTWAGLTVELAATWRVVTYDRRGHGRSQPAVDRAPVGLAEHADDAHWLLEALTDESAAVFGAGTGAAIGLELIARCPCQVRRLVALQPPASDRAPDATAVLAELAERVVVGVGQEPTDTRDDRAATVLAGQIGAVRMAFPDGRVGPRTRPALFARALRRALGEAVPHVSATTAYRASSRDSASPPA